MRDWYSGSALAFQANDRGSTPLSRSKELMATLSKKAEELIEKFTSFQDDLDSLEYDLETENDELTDLQSELDSAMNTIHGMQKDIADKRKSINKAQKAIDDFLATQRDNALKSQTQSNSRGWTRSP
jgi:predicted  nucleic acid-binding Zn-ribbon protein